MLEQALSELAAVGGSAVVSAAGTDAWTGLRQALAHWFGRGSPQREEAERERLQQTDAVLRGTDPAEADQARMRLAASWQARIEVALETLEETDLDQAVRELRAVLHPSGPPDGTSGGAGGLGVAGNVDIHAESGSIAAGVIHGGAQIAHPTVPAPFKG